MNATCFRNLGVLQFLTAAGNALAADGRRDEPSGLGLVVILLVVAIAYAGVLLLRVAVRGRWEENQLRDMDAIEFDKFTRSADSPTIERY